MAAEGKTPGWQLVVRLLQATATRTLPGLHTSPSPSSPLVVFDPTPPPPSSAAALPPATQASYTNTHTLTLHTSHINAGAGPGAS